MERHDGRRPRGRPRLLLTPSTQAVTNCRSSQRPPAPAKASRDDGASTSPWSGVAFLHNVACRQPAEQLQGTRGGSIKMREGVFTCRLCGLPVFKAGTKFESGTGWPSFTAPFDEDHLRRVRDAHYATETFEVVRARCGAQQGHVFNDGPPPSGLRYCINSVALRFTPKGERLPNILCRGAPEGQVWNG